MEWGEPDLVDDEVGAEQGFDDAADGAVGQAPVEGLDEVSGGEGADPVARLGRRGPQGHPDLRLTRPRRAHPGAILTGGGTLPRREALQCEVRERGRGG